MYALAEVRSNSCKGGGDYSFVSSLMTNPLTHTASGQCFTQKGNYHSTNANRILARVIELFGNWTQSTIIQRFGLISLTIEQNRNKKFEGVSSIALDLGSNPTCIEFSTTRTRASIKYCDSSSVIATSYLRGYMERRSEIQEHEKIQFVRVWCVATVPKSN